MVYPKKVFFRDYAFIVDEHVYEPAEDTFLIAENMTITEDDAVLEIGTGCGILALLAAEKAKTVVAVDLNPYALKCASRNAETYEVKNIEFRYGDLFQPIRRNERFNLVVFNSPYLPSELDEEKSWIGKAWAGGPSGRQVIDRFIADVPKFLTDEGRILLIQSSLSDVDKTLELFRKRKLEAFVVARVKVPFESIVLVEAKR
jgi:release factor glutamine methyltransferase